MQLESTEIALSKFSQEYNDIRTNYYGLVPIVIYEEFDDGGFSNPNMECIN